MTESDFATLRQAMVGEIVAHTVFVTGRLGKAALGRRTIEAMAKVPRHAFVRLELQPFSYANTPLPSGYGVVLEIGTGLGYQATVLAELALHVYSIELIDELAGEARRRLHRHGYVNVDIRSGDGRAGWHEHAPFDKIIVTAAPDLVPPSLIYQLKRGGRMVIPAGLADAQQLLLVEKDSSDTVSTREILPVRFSQLEEVEAG